MIKKLLKKHQQLINTTINITKREIKVRYANSFLGSLWFILYPLVFASITTFIFSFAFKGKINDIPYFLYVFIGFNSWLWFNQTIIQATRSPVSNRGLIINNKFPTESIIFSITIARIPDFIVGFLFCYIILISSNQNITITGLYVIILTAFSQLMFQVGLALLVTTINVFIRDFQNIIEILLQLLFYATPIIYSIDIVPQNLKKILEINPMTQIISTYRNAFSNNYISFLGILSLFLISLIVFILGYFLYKKYEMKFAENL